MNERPEGPVRRVVVIGAESTGKTTLARSLAEAYETTWVPEYLRRFVDERGRLPEPGDTRTIARGHLDLERAALEHARRVLFYDTDLLLTCVYHRYYFGPCPAWVSNRALARLADLYLLTDTDIPWTPDPGQRDGPSVRAAIDTRVRAELYRHGIRPVLLSGTHEERLATAVAAVDELVGGGSVSGL